MTQAEIPVATAIAPSNPMVYSTSSQAYPPDNTNQSYPAHVINQPYLEANFAGTGAMNLVWRLGKTTRFFALIDVIFCLLTFLQYPPLLIVSVLPLMGYYGAKEYCVWKIYCYALFVFLNFGLRIYAYTKSTSVVGLTLSIISILVEFWILRIVFRFIKMIKGTNQDHLAILRDPSWSPIQTHLVWS
jgi:hypothetical protein